MTKYYSATTNGFYSVPDINPLTSLPGDSVEVSDSTWLTLLQSQITGSIIMPDENGNPISVMPT